MKEKIIEILQNIRPELDYTASNDFIADGYIDSFDVVTLVASINDQLNVNIKPSDIIPENFVNIESIINLINKYNS